MRKVYLWSITESKWAKNCMKIVCDSGMRVRGVNRERESQYLEWKVSDSNGEGMDWDEREWKKVIESCVKWEGLRRWRERMEQKSSLEWYKSKKAPQYVRWYDCRLGGDLLFQARARCINVNARNFRWSESGCKACQMCESGVDETVEHVILECGKYERDRQELLRVVQKEIFLKESEIYGVNVRTKREWMLLLLGLNGEVNDCTMNAMKIFLERVWYIRNRCIK